MPELPEVETMCRGIASVVGAKVVAVPKPQCRRRPIAISPPWPQLKGRLVNQRVAAVERLGKRVIMRLASSDRLVFEPRMTGLVLLDDPPTKEHIRLLLELRHGRYHMRLRFWDQRGLGRVSLVNADLWLPWLDDVQLGPDALTLTLAALPERLARSSREIKVALLDQRALAGIGNLYASEILHVAGIHPQLRCHQLGDGEWQRLHKALRRVLSQAIRFEGSTLSDGTYRNALNQAGSYQNHHRVYDRAGQRCRTCKVAVICRIVQAQRSTFFCPNCQTARVGER